MVPIERADVVGIGYRCDVCSATSHGEQAEVEDNVSPEDRERLAKQGKRKFFGALGASGAIMSVPTVVGFALGGPIGAGVAALLGFYCGSWMFSAFGEASYQQWKRHRRPALPPARLRK